MMNLLRGVLGLVVVFSQAAVAQARVLSAPPEPSLLNITRHWSRPSSLGDLREIRAGRGYLELRVWGGYTLTTGTQSVVLRRTNGRWSAFLARVLRCSMQLPTDVSDTASPATMQRYRAEARQQCGTLRDVGAGARILTSDSLVVEPLSVPEAAIERAWTAAVRAGVLELPGRVTRTGVMDDVFTYVVELRSGDEYRASMIEHLERPETRADQQIKDVYGAVSRVLKPEQMLRPVLPP
jgi:hypothetical protein